MVDLAKLHSLMDKAGMEAIIVLNKNALWLTGHFDFERFLFGPYDIAPLIAVVAFPDKSFLLGGIFERTDFPGERIDIDQIPEARYLRVVEELKRRNLQSATIGIDMDTAPAGALAILSAHLPGARFVSADLLLAQMRSVKSPEEIANITNAVAIGEEAFQVASSVLHEGVAIREVAIAWGRTVIGLGALPLFCMPYDFFTHATFAELPAENRGLSRYPTYAERGCVTRLDIGCNCNGYYSDHKIVFCIGKPDEESVAVYEDHRSRQEFMRSFVRPGMTKTQVYSACLKEFKNVERYPFWIHGIGMDLREEPRLGSMMAYAVNVKPELTFEVNTVVALEPSWLVEDDYVLREDGFERLGKLPQTIMRF